MNIGIKSKINWNTFHKYKNLYTNRTCVVCGTGSTLNNYNPINNAIHIGCNGCVFYEKIKFDFYFFNDWSVTRPDIRNEIIKYQPRIDKFFGCFIHNRRYGCNINHAEQGGAKLYDLECSYSKNRSGFQPLIDEYCIGNSGKSTIFACMQFALFAGFRSVYIVGCDLDSTQFKYIKGAKNGSHKLKTSWIKFKDFASLNFSNTSIGVINPIGLKGLFDTVSI